MDDFEGKVAVVTGAASGIGLGLATRFGREGMAVVLADVQRDALDGAAATLAAELGADRVLAVPTDVRHEEDVLRAGRGHGRAVRHRARAVQQRRHRHRRPRLDGPGRPLALDRRRQPPRRGPRHPRVRAPHDRAGRGPRGQHRVGRGPHHGPGAWRPTSPPSTRWWRCPSRCTSTCSSLARRVGVSVLCPEWVRTNIADSERNRPPEVAEVVLPPDAPVEARSIVQGLVAGGLDPLDVAGMVLDGIRTGRFWIFTHDTTLGVAKRRWDAIASDGQPTLWDVMEGMEPST